MMIPPLVPNRAAPPGSFRVSPVESLLRGRLEISRLSLTEPKPEPHSQRQWRWNIEHLLERTAQVAVAPHGKGRFRIAPAFPYIEAERGRINFKVARKKKTVCSDRCQLRLLAGFRDAWGMRLRAQPLRTDLNLTDMGQVRVSGTGCGPRLCAKLQSSSICNGTRRSWAN